MDMNQCKKGDKLILRNGQIATYVERRYADVVSRYPHIIMLDETKLELSRSNEGYVIAANNEDFLDVIFILDIKSILKEAFDAGADYVDERNFVDSEGYMDFHKDYEIKAPNFDNWYKNNAFKINTIK